MSALRERVLADVARSRPPTRAEWRRRVALVAVLGALGTTAVFFVMGGFARGTRPSELVAFTVGIGFFSALILTRLSTNAGTSSMLGLPRVHLVLACVVAAPVLACVAFAATMIWPEHANEEVGMHAHLSCGAITLAQGALPLVALLIPRRGADPVHPMVTGAALGMTAGAWTAMMAYLRCPHVPASHCILAHVLPTLVLTVLGAVLGRFLLRVR